MDPRIFSLCGVPLKVACQTASQLSTISNQWQRFFVLGDESKLPAAVVYTFEEPGHSRRPVPDGVEVFRSEHLLVRKTARGFFLSCESASLDIDAANGRCQGVLAGAFWDLPLEYQREFFLLSFLMVLRPLGFYGLHANGLLHNGTGYLVSGDSGSGKTTLALTLVREGWGFLSDDALVLHKAAQGIEALPLRRGFSCTVQTTSRFPEIKETVDEAPAFSDGKKLVDISREFPDSFRPSAVPGVLLFPAIIDGPHSTLTPIDPTETVVGLLEQSPGIMIEKQWVIEQMNVLKLLVQQARCYRVQLGADVFEAPNVVAELITSTAVRDDGAGTIRPDNKANEEA